MPSIRDSKQDSDSAITPAAEAVHVPAHLSPPGSLQARHLCHLHAQPLLGHSCCRQKKKKKEKKKILHLCMQGRFSSVQLFVNLWTVACHASLSGGSLARILECIDQYWLSYPSRALYVQLPYLPTPQSTWCCQNPCDPSSCTTSTPGPHRGRLKSSRAASGFNPSG